MEFLKYVFLCTILKPIRCQFKRTNIRSNWPQGKTDPFSPVIGSVIMLVYLFFLSNAAVFIYDSCLRIFKGCVALKS